MVHAKQIGGGGVSVKQLQEEGSHGTSLCEEMPPAYREEARTSLKSWGGSPGVLGSTQGTGESRGQARERG